MPRAAVLLDLDAPRGLFQAAALRGGEGVLEADGAGTKSSEEAGVWE